MENELAMNIIVGAIGIVTVVISIWMIWSRYEEVKHQQFDETGSLIIISLGGLILWSAHDYYTTRLLEPLDIWMVILGCGVGVVCVGSGLYALWEDYIKKT